MVTTFESEVSDMLARLAGSGAFPAARARALVQMHGSQSDLPPLVDRANSSLCVPLGFAWQLLCPERAPTLQPIAADDTNGYRSLYWVNRELNAVPGAILETAFTCPPGVTSVHLEAEVAAGGAANPIVLQICDALGTVLSSKSIVPGTLALYSTPALTVTPGTEYRLRVDCTASGQADAKLGNVRLKVDAATGFFGDGFIRIDASELRDNNERGRVAARYPSQSAYSHLDLLTDAASIVVETYNNLGLYVVAPNDAACVLVDGKVRASIDPAVDRVDHTTVTIPQDGYPYRMHHVSVLSGPQVSQSGYEVTPRGVHIAAVYVPASAALNKAPVQEGQETWVVYGDSKTAGYYSDSPGRDGLVPLLRASGRRVICEAYGGRFLATDVSATLTQAACTPFARKLLRENPDKIVIAIGRNDFVGAAYTQANWSTQLGNLLDAIHALNARTKVILVKFTRESTEAINGNGDTWDGWRGIMDTVASSRSEWVRVVAGDQLWTVTNAASYTADGVHPNSRGYALLAAALIGWEPAVTGAADQLGPPYPWTPLALGSGLKAWWSPRAKLTAASMGAVTATGTSPALSLSGVPLFAFSLLVVVTTGGALGTAKFKLSVDGGQSWLLRDQTISASVVVNVLGITLGFAAGTYVAADDYRANTKISQADDLSSHGNHLVQATDSKRFQYLLQGFNVPGRVKKTPAFQCAAASQTSMSCVMTLTSPFSIFAAAKMIDQASIRTLVGGGGSAIYFYSNTATTMAANSGLQQVATVAAVSPHVYGVTFGASGAIRVDGSQAVAGSTGANSPTTFYLGGDVANGQWFWDDMIGDVLILDHAATAVEAAQIEAWFRTMHATW